MNRNIIGMMLVMFYVLAMTPAVFAQTNGSFEQGTKNPGNGWWVVPAGSTIITGWTVDSGNVDYIGLYWQASNGTRSIDMNGSIINMNGLGAGQISQTLETVPGWTYIVTFDMSGNPDGGPCEKIMSVSAGDLTAQSYTYNTCFATNTRSNMKWESETFYFTATDSETVLTFASKIPGWYGPALDNVNVTVATQVCHRNNGNKGPKTLTIGEPAVAAHLNHGDSIGPCTEDTTPDT
ncbi:MAG: choice-of-anchor C family protein [Acidobacteria bacterium]|nr:choice-of-anchor C family protein [Acidobacteriota bacterium]MCA1640090.1 choice-of-anchor C family protein [Acidobacteriota bacterium]